MCLRGWSSFERLQQGTISWNEITLPCWPWRAHICGYLCKPYIASDKLSIQSNTVRTSSSMFLAIIRIKETLWNQAMFISWPIDVRDVLRIGAGNGKLIWLKISTQHGVIYIRIFVPDITIDGSRGQAAGRRGWGQLSTRPNIKTNLFSIMFATKINAVKAMVVHETTSWYDKIVSRPLLLQ